MTAGIDPKRIVFAGVGKSREEIRYALSSRILQFNVESAQELYLINAIAREMGVKAPVALRVNPDIDPKTHPYISTGLKKSKFGISAKDAAETFRTASKLLHIEVIGIHQHIGSQLISVRPFVDATKRILRLVDRLEDTGIRIRTLDLGGGLGITYSREAPPHPVDFAKALKPLLAGRNFQLILEPGRVLTGNAGILVTKVLYTKSGERKDFVIVDAGMNDLIRPSLYDAYHEILPVARSRRKAKLVDVVGPICESGDFLARGRRLPGVLPGELLAVMSAGAYGHSMASNYNARPRPPEILVDGKNIHVVRERETYADLIRGEKVP